MNQFVEIENVQTAALAFIADRSRMRRYRQCWYQFVGTHYREIDDEKIEGDLRLWMVKNGANPSMSQVSNLREQVGANLYVDRDKVLPCFLKNDGNLDPCNIVACNNGLLDTETRQLHPHNDEWFSLNCLPYDYHPSAVCPLWESFLRQVLVDEDQIALAQEWAGYILTHDTRQQKLLFSLGRQRAGKGVFYRALVRLVGAYNVATPSLQELAGPFGLQGMIGKQLAVISELHLSGNAKTAVEILKRITGEDSVDVHRKHKDPLNSVFMPLRFAISANELPRLPDDSNALQSRLLLLFFPNCYLGQEDKELEKRLESEQAGILNWALAGLERLRQRGKFIQPERGLPYIEEFGRMSAPIANFAADHIDLAPDHWEPTELLYLAYKQWAHSHGYQPASHDVFGNRLHLLYPMSPRKKRIVNGLRKWGYQGIKLNAEGRKCLPDCLQ